MSRISSVMEQELETKTKDKAACSPLGQLLLERGLIIPQDLEFAMDHQKYSKKLLGEILVRMGALSQKDLEAVLSEQKKSA